MDERDAEFLWDNERAYIRGEPDTDKRRMKSQLKNRSASPETLSSVLETFRTDAELVEHFWRERMVDDGGRYYWEDIVLPANEDEIRRLRNILDAWLTHAETNFLEREDDLLADHFDPLWEDLDLDEHDEDRLPRLLFGRVDEVDARPKENAREELAIRREALIALLREPELRDILDWIEDHPKRPVPENEDYKQSTWRWAASRWLENKYGVVEASDAWPHIYERTARGDAVSATLQELVTSTTNAVVGLPDDEKLRKWLSLLHRRKNQTR